MEAGQLEAALLVEMAGQAWLRLVQKRQCAQRAQQAASERAAAEPLRMIRNTRENDSFLGPCRRLQQILALPHGSSLTWEIHAQQKSRQRAEEQ